jgi:hypothetical protein
VSWYGIITIPWEDTTRRYSFFYNSLISKIGNLKVVNDMAMKFLEWLEDI